ncbi:MAG: glutathione S-transferase family protein [Myxococcota bacterium]
MESFVLFGRPGWGSVLVEAQLVWYGVPFEYRQVGDLFADPDAGRELRTFNPLVQVPTLIVDDGAVMTESAAITLWLAERFDSTELVPAPRTSERGPFLRWLLFLTSNIYPTYTYVDDPSRFVGEPAAQRAFATTVNQYAERLYSIVDSAASRPWFLGDRMSALDLYICTMTHWRPGRPWFEANAPALVAIADRAEALSQLARVWERNFPPGQSPDSSDPAGSDSA